MEVKSERKVGFGQMRYRMIDLMEIHHYKLIITPLVHFWALKHPKTSKIAMDPLKLLLLNVNVMLTSC